MGKSHSTWWMWALIAIAVVALGIEAYRQYPRVQGMDDSPLHI